MFRRRENSPDRPFMIHDRYEPILKLGEGTFGKVYKARDRCTGDVVALKKCRIQMDLEGVPPTTIREVSLLKVLGRSNHIVKLLGAEPIDEDGKSVLYLIFEYVQQDLKGFMGADKAKQHLPVAGHLLKPFMFQLLRGVAFMHQHGIMHRDLKPQNLLVDPQEHVLKVADLGLGRACAMPAKAYTHECFADGPRTPLDGTTELWRSGSARTGVADAIGSITATRVRITRMVAVNLLRLKKMHSDERLRAYVVTLWYRAPEILLGGKHYALPVDMWSVGCIFGEMARGPPLFPSDCEFAQLLTIFQIMGTPSEDTWPGVTQLKDWHAYPQWEAVDMHAYMSSALDEAGVDLLQQLLRYNPDERISAKKALLHPWFDDLDKDAMDALENPDVLADGLNSVWCRSATSM